MTVPSSVGRRTGARVRHSYCPRGESVNCCKGREEKRNRRMPLNKVSHLPLTFGGDGACRQSEPDIRERQGWKKGGG